MTLRRRIFSGIAIILLLVIISAAVAVSYDAPCVDASALPEGTQRMRAIVARCYGPPEVLQLEEIAKPVPADDEVLVKVHAAAINPADWHGMRGKPYVMRLAAGIGKPDDVRQGIDYAGTVEAVGKSVTRFKPGDEVFGGRGGALAEYVTVRESRAIVPKPANVTFEQAASVGVAAVTALQGLRDAGHVQAGHKVLINGASGGVGTFSVQIAKLLGAEVTGVCSTRNVELVRSLGADHVVDYTQEDFTANGVEYDMILDNVGNRSLADYRRALKPKGRLVIIGGGGPEMDGWIGPLLLPLKAAVLSLFVDDALGMYIAELKPADLTQIADWMAAGKVTPVIDRRYPLSETEAAMTYLEAGLSTPFPHLG
jgi:NADPH:quinone reductase-like Zn-dependent oxidoreductase